MSWFLVFRFFMFGLWVLVCGVMGLWFQGLWVYGFLVSKIYKNTLHAFRKILILYPRFSKQIRGSSSLFGARFSEFWSKNSKAGMSDFRYCKHNIFKNVSRIVLVFLK